MPRIRRPGEPAPITSPVAGRPNRNRPSRPSRPDPRRRDPRKNTGKKQAGTLQENYIQENPQDYYNLVTDRAGLGAGMGVQPFHQWVNANGWDMVNRGYSNALAGGNKELTFQDYMTNAYGIPKSKAALAPVDTGNAFTSSSVPGTFNKFLQSKNLNKGQIGENKMGNLRQNYRKKKKGAAGAIDGAEMLGPSANPADYAQLTEMFRRNFQHLTPEQAGTYSPGYAMGPSRWSVFG